MTTEHGRIIAVNRRILGDELAVDHPAGTTTLTLDDVTDFSEAGGQVLVNGDLLDYLTVDDDTSTITLAGITPTPSALPAETRINLWDTHREQVAQELVAQVEVDGEEENVDPIEALVPHHLMPYLAEGIRDDGTGESVTLELTPAGDWTIADMPGRDPIITGTTIETSPDGNRVVIGESESGGHIYFYSGAPDETSPAFLTTSSSAFTLSGKRTAEVPSPAILMLYGSAQSPATALASADAIRLRAPSINTEGDAKVWIDYGLRVGYWADLPWLRSLDFATGSATTSANGLITVPHKLASIPDIAICLPGGSGFFVASIDSKTSSNVTFILHSADGSPIVSGSRTYQCIFIGFTQA